MLVIVEGKKDGNLKPTKQYNHVDPSTVEICNGFLFFSHDSAAASYKIRLTDCEKITMTF